MINTSPEIPIKSSVAFVTYEGKIALLLRDNKPSIPEPNLWGLIGGISEEGEDPLAAFMRESQEEIGIRPKRVRFLFDCPETEGRIYHAELDLDERSRIRKGDEGQMLEFFPPNYLPRLQLTKAVKTYLNSYSQYLIGIIS